MPSRARFSVLPFPARPKGPMPFRARRGLPVGQCAGAVLVPHLPFVGFLGGDVVVLPTSVAAVLFVVPRILQVRAGVVAGTLSADPVAVVLPGHPGGAVRQRPTWPRRTLVSRRSFRSSCPFPPTDVLPAVPRPDAAELLVRDLRPAEVAVNGRDGCLCVQRTGSASAVQYDICRMRTDAQIGAKRTRMELYAHKSCPWLSSRKRAANSVHELFEKMTKPDQNGGPNAI